MAWEDSYAKQDQEEAIATLEYAKRNYMDNRNVYIWDEEKAAPILLVFPYFIGPRRSFKPDELLSIVKRLNISPVFSYLFPQVNEEGGFLNVPQVESTYAWVIGHPWDGTKWGKSELDMFYNFLKGNKKNVNFAIAACYPGFDDIGVDACWVLILKMKTPIVLLGGIRQMEIHMILRGSGLKNTDILLTKKRMCLCRGCRL